MIIAGNKNRFAIEGNVHTKSGDWRYGTFFMWLGGERLGNPDDYEAMNIAIGWMIDFIEKPVNLVDEAYFSMSMEEMNRITGDDSSPDYLEPYGHFNINYFGASTFDRDKVCIMLIKNKRGEEKCLWKTKDHAFKEIIFESGYVEEVIKEFISKFKPVLDAFGEQQA